MLKYTESDGALIFTVLVAARASRSQIVGAHDGALRVRVSAPPVEGAANAELLRTLASALNVPLRNVEITSGHSARLKHVRVRGAQACALLGLVERK